MEIKFSSCKLPNDHYSATKAEGEALVIKSNGIIGFRTCCIRPSGIFGADDKLLVPSLVDATRKWKSKCLKLFPFVLCSLFEVENGHCQFFFSSLHPDFEHVCDQILSSEQIPSMNSLITRLLWVPTITKGDGIAIENSTMVASCGRGRSGPGTRGMIRNDRGGRDSLDSCPLSSTDPTLDLPSSSPSHDSNIGWPIALRKEIYHRDGHLGDKYLFDEDT
ncbi:3beta-hydroxysteroid-dehydrogenase/decarboxylase isoform 1, partial [Mucuna pruriens]